VNTAKVSDEEVKYTVDAEGYIKELSKTVKGGLQQQAVLDDCELEAALEVVLVVDPPELRDERTLVALERANQFV
jgi:hypothetical protein